MNFPPFIIEAVVAIFGFYMARHAYMSYKYAMESSNWPSINGKVISLELWGRRNIDGKMVESENLKVRYEYEVQLRKYNGKNSAFYTLHYPETVNLYNSINTDSNVVVYYNPINPSQSVLVTGRHPTKPYGGLILASLFIMVSLIPLLISFFGIFY